MKKAIWGIVSAAAVLALFGGTATVHAQHSPATPPVTQHRPAYAEGHGEFPVGTDHHVGQFSFAVTAGHNGPEGSFEFNELNGQRHVVEHLLVRPIDHLSIAGHTAQIEGATLWHNRHARVRVIATDDGEHHDSLSLRVVAVDGTDAGKVLYTAAGYLTSGAIHVYAP